MRQAALLEKQIKQRRVVQVRAAAKRHELE
jgi:hypothetical protein